MIRAIAKPTLLLLVLITACLTAGMFAQSAGDNSQTATGCLQQGKESGGFYLISNDNHHWELYPAKDVNLAQYVGQTVTVTGGEAHRTAAQEEKSQPYEKQETGTMEHGDLQVSNVTVVSQTCSK
jgi:hypothetical protein